MWQVLRSSFKLRMGLIGVLIVVALAMLAPVLSRIWIGEAHYKDFGTAPLMLPPSWARPLGTDSMGRDLTALTLYALRDSLMIGGLAGVIATTFGILVGFTAGYKGGKIDSFLRSLADTVLVIPTLPLLIILAATVRSVDIFAMAFILSIFGWAGPSRGIRAQVLSLRERPYVELAQLNNEKDGQVIFGELVPNLLPYLGLGLATSVIGAILAETGLELIGFGPGIATLGYLIYNAMATGMITMGRLDMIAVPAGLLVILFLSLNLINMGLEETYNPRLRGVTAD